MHLHAVIRLDRALPAHRGDEVRPPGARFTLELLEEGIRAVASDVTVPVPEAAGGGFLRWGDELDVLPITGGRGLEPGRCAGYQAKYATKATEQAGGVLHQVSEPQVDALAVRDHVRAYLRRTFVLAAEPALKDRRLGRYAHAFGYRGHCLTKSRRYSTTFKALREARERHVHERLLARSTDAAQRALAAMAPRDRIGFFTYAGQGASHNRGGAARLVRGREGTGGPADRARGALLDSRRELEGLMRTGAGLRLLGRRGGEGRSERWVMARS